MRIFPVKLFLLFLIVSIGIQKTSAQNVGLLFHDINVSDGYTLFSPQQNNEVFLINNCGEKVHQWTFTETPGATCYFLENGNLLRAGKDHLEIRDWSNQIVWNYATTANGIAQHHDIEPLPNGNILCIVTDLYSKAIMTAQGRNPDITNANFKLDKIIELQPIGNNDAVIVWEWKFFNHFIQDFDATKPNFGVVQNHPELLDLNFNNGEASDYTHVNSIDYNAEFDQIMISTRHVSEIHIIDHSTTTTEAASHSGGNSNKGGDFLWRWGNQQVYKQGTTANQKLFLQHDCKWVETGFVDSGKITVYNNGGDIGDFSESSVYLITPEIIGNQYSMTNSLFNPASYEWSWNGEILGNTMLEGRQSGVQSLSNGNVLICETSFGRISEITKTGNLLWSYKNPTGSIFDGTPIIYNHNSTIIGQDNGIFKCDKYPSNFIGFIGKDLTPIGIIETENTVSNACNALSIGSNNLKNISILNPIQNNSIEFNQHLEVNALTIFDLNGRTVFSQSNFSGNSLAIQLKTSIYFMHLQKNETTFVFKIIIP